MYPYNLVFSEDRRAYEESRFWFTDGMHWPDPLPPWDASLVDIAFASLSQFNTRVFALPPANGLSARILNGYVYLSPVSADPADFERRSELFMERAGYYYAHWDELYEAWMVKVRDLVESLERIDIVGLPEFEDIDDVRSGRGLTRGHDLTVAYFHIIDAVIKIWNYHFELLNLGYAAYLDFFGFCKRAWPNIPDLAIAKMVAGVDVDLFRPDEELKRLAHLAVTSGCADAFVTGDVERSCEALQATHEGRAWIAAFQESAEPWFNFSTGSGFYHKDKIWIEHIDVPFEFIRNYIEKLQQGHDIARPIDAIHAERERISGEYADLLGTDADRAAFHARLQLARSVFPYVENHNFYVEHWTHSVIWRKMRAIGAILVKANFIEEPDDIFFLTRGEIPDALADLYTSWAVPEPARGPSYWPPIVAKRRAMLEAMRHQKPPPVLGIPPAHITEPFTVMLWGVTSEAVRLWLGQDECAGTSINGMPASAGCVEGIARVVHSPDDIRDVQDGEILVAPLTAPSWAPIFGRIAATVTDAGGMMSHAAIVCREYGLPAVTGTSNATRLIRSGQRIRVDGSAGVVTVLDDEKVLVLDFGGPLLKTPYELLQQACARLGIDPAQLPWHGPWDPSADDTFGRFLQGELSERELWAQYAEQFGDVVGAQMDVQQLMAQLYPAGTESVLRDEAVSLLRDARAAGVRVAMLTNDLAAFHNADWRSQLSIIDEFDVIVDGSVEDVLKPDPTIYELLCERLGIAPFQAVYLDDQPANVAGGAACGMHSILVDVTDPGPAFRAAREHIGLVAVE